MQKLGELLKYPPNNAKINKIATDPQPAMPEHCKIPGDAVASYRKYYISGETKICNMEKSSKKHQNGILKE